MVERNKQTDSKKPEPVQSGTQPESPPQPVSPFPPRPKR